MWDYMYDCAKQYWCESFIYLLSCLAFGFCIIIGRAVGVSCHVKSVVYCINSRDKHMLKLKTTKPLNNGLINVNPNFYKFMKVHETE